MTEIRWHWDDQLGHIGTVNTPPPPKENNMTDPDRPALDDVCTSIAEAIQLNEAIRLTLDATRRTGHRGAIERLAEELLDRVWEEPDLANARALDAATERDMREENRRDAFADFDVRRTALDLAIQHHRNLSDRPPTTGLPKIGDLADEFHDILAGVVTNPDGVRSEPPRRGLDALIPTSPEGPPYPVHQHHGATVYREGNRILRTDGTGYSDAVSDSAIHGHFAEHTRNGNQVDARFCRAVLAIRAYERIAS